MDPRDCSQRCCCNLQAPLFILLWHLQGSRWLLVLRANAWCPCVCHYPWGYLMMFSILCHAFFQKGLRICLVDDTQTVTSLLVLVRVCCSKPFFWVGGWGWKCGWLQRTCHSIWRRRRKGSIGENHQFQGFLSGSRGLEKWGEPGDSDVSPVSRWRLCDPLHWRSLPLPIFSSTKSQLLWVVGRFQGWNQLLPYRADSCSSLWPLESESLGMGPGNVPF